MKRVLPLAGLVFGAAVLAMLLKPKAKQCKRKHKRTPDSPTWGQKTFAREDPRWMPQSAEDILQSFARARRWIEDAHADEPPVVVKLMDQDWDDMIRDPGIPWAVAVATHAVELPPEMLHP